MNIYLVLLKALLDSKNYTQYYKYLNLETLDKNYPELYRLYVVLPQLHQKQDHCYTIDDLYLVLYASYPKADQGFYNLLYKQLTEIVVDATSIRTYLEKLREREKAISVAKLALRVAEGQGDWADLKAELHEPVEEISDDSWQEDFVSNSYVALMQEYEVEPGLRWRLPSLNRALGSLRKGNFGFVFARPETGKTTFLASEVSFMAEQTDRPVIWFNNEQARVDVGTRAIQGALGWTREQMEQDRVKTDAEYQKKHSNFIINDNGHTTRNKVELILEKTQPALVIFDQIDAIKGFQADRNDLELKAIYEWARALAKDYCPVIAICQAGGSGDGKKWLTMNDVDSSKTGKQGTADWILGIGATNEPGEEYLRFMHLSKNKLHGDKDSDPQMRHGRWQVFIKPEIARYTEIGAG